MIDEKKDLGLGEISHCIECRSDLAAGAIRCKICGSHQSRWKNCIKFWASVSGFLTAILAVSGYLVANYEVIRTTLFWKEELIVIRVDYGEIELYNIGDGPIFALEFNVIIDERGYPYIPAFQAPIGRIVPRGEKVLIKYEHEQYRCRSNDFLMASDVSDDIKSSKEEMTKLIDQYKPFYLAPEVLNRPKSPEYDRISSEFWPVEPWLGRYETKTAAEVSYISLTTGDIVSQPLNFVTIWSKDNCQD